MHISAARKVLHSIQHHLYTQLIYTFHIAKDRFRIVEWSRTNIDEISSVKFLINVVQAVAELLVIVHHCTNGCDDTSILREDARVQVEKYLRFGEVLDDICLESLITTKGYAHVNILILQHVDESICVDIRYSLDHDAMMSSHLLDGHDWSSFPRCGAKGWNYVLLQQSAFEKCELLQLKRYRSLVGQVDIVGRHENEWHMTKSKEFWHQFAQHEMGEKVASNEERYVKTASEWKTNDAVRDTRGMSSISVNGGGIKVNTSGQRADNM
jgi:hypothetical protein